jgi:hypothetical protein
MKKFKEFIKEDAFATMGNTGGMGAVVAAQPGSIPGTQGTTGSGDIGQPLATYSKPVVNMKRHKKNKKKLRNVESFDMFMMEENDIDNFTARYYDNYDDEEEPSYEVNLQDIDENNIKKIQMYEKDNK